MDGKVTDASALPSPCTSQVTVGAQSDRLDGRRGPGGVHFVETGPEPGLIENATRHGSFGPSTPLGWGHSVTSSLAETLLAATKAGAGPAE
jgi:hypothetical protein